MKTKSTLIATMMYLIIWSIYAQETVKIAKETRLLLPDGKTIGFDKVDSVLKAWGTDQVVFSHSEEDDQNGVMRLIRKTQKMQDDEIAHQKALNAMLNNPAPDFTLTDMDGKEVNLASLKGKVVVLNFWFIGCAPCIAEMPALNKLVNHYHSDRVAFLALGRDKIENTQRFLKKHQFQYRILPNAVSVAENYNVHSFPTSIIIHPEGVIRLITSSSQKIEEVLRTEIDKLISHP